MLHPYDIFALAGATIIFTKSTLFAFVRKLWPKFLGCPLCVGFWVGIIAGGWLHRLGPIGAFYAGCVVSITAYTLVLVHHKLDQ